MATKQKKSRGKKTAKFTPGSFRLRVRRSKAGLGLFTEDAIQKGACVIEYTGRELTPAAAEVSRSKYLFQIGKKKTIDGAARTNTARYINHSCRPNCEIDIWDGRVYVLAKRNVKPGEELSYDYDTEYFDQYIKPRGCCCPRCQPQK